MAGKCSLQQKQCWAPLVPMYCMYFYPSLHSLKISKIDQEKKDRLVYMYLFLSDSQELDKSINHQLAHSELWQQLRAQNNLSISNNNLDAGKITTQDNTKHAATE